jgi:hypothetical protein
MTSKMSTMPRPVAVCRRISAVLALVGSLGLAAPARAQAPSATPVPRFGPAPAPAAVPAPAPAPPPDNWPQPAPGYGAQPAPGYGPQPAPGYGPPSVPPSAVGPNGEYVAPLSQTTQPSYLPQSVALSGPRMLRDWHDGDPIPYGYHREERARKGEVISGAILFGVPYLYSAFFASIGADASSSTGDNKLGWLYLPVLGPVIEMSEYDSATFRFVLALDAIAQGVGAGLFFHGLTSPRPVLVRNDLALVTIMPAPVGKEGSGLVLMGRF